MLALIKAGAIVQLVAEGGGFGTELGWTVPAETGWTSGDYSLVTVLDADPVPDGKQVAGTVAQMIDGAPKFVDTLEDVPRAMVAKSTVQQRIIDAGRMADAYAALTANAVYFARWFAPDHPAVYCDDADAVALVTALGLDPAVILAA
jgi:hypothetical protein